MSSHICPKCGRHAEGALRPDGTLTVVRCQCGWNWTDVAPVPEPAVPSERANVVYLPMHSGDGYSYGGGAILTIGRNAFVAGEGDTALVAEEAARRWNAVPALIDVLDDILNYSGGANSALDDPYVMERARAALAAARGEKS